MRSQVSRIRAASIPLAWVILGAGLQAGCGGVTNPNPEPKRKVIDEEQWALEPGEAAGADLSLSGLGSGTVDATVEWTFATNDVDLFVTATLCTPEMFRDNRCSFAAKANSPSAKPERVSFKVSAGDSYRFWIVDVGPEAESGTFVVGLTQ